MRSPFKLSPPWLGGSGHWSALHLISQACSRQSPRGKGCMGVSVGCVWPFPAPLGREGMHSALSLCRDQSFLGSYLKWRWKQQILVHWVKSEQRCQCWGQNINIKAVNTQSPFWKESVPPFKILVSSPSSHLPHWVGLSILPAYHRDYLRSW